MNPACPRTPERPFFSSGPCAKHPGWSVDCLADARIGRSHRAAVCKQRLGEVISRSAVLLGLPSDYKLAIMPGSDTGAFEAAMWSLLGPAPVDVFAWDSFGQDWVRDVVTELGCDASVHTADYGHVPDPGVARPHADLVFAWNGTTSGVCLPDADWIAPDRQGLSLCDATSAVFARRIDWSKLDVASWSWQKSLGGEAAHGMLALSPRAIERLASHRPSWPVPKLFRLADDGKISDSLFAGATINTPSMLCVEDYLAALDWAERIGGLPALMSRADTNLACVTEWVEATGWVDFLCSDARLRSNTSVTLKIVDPEVCSGGDAAVEAIVKRMVSDLEQHNAAFDIGAYRHAPPGLRLWCGPTVETADIGAALEWIDWAWHRATRQG